MLFGEAAALPCTLEEQVQIAHLLTAYDRWLVGSSSPAPLAASPCTGPDSTKVKQQAVLHNNCQLLQASHVSIYKLQPPMPSAARQIPCVPSLPVHKQHSREQ